MKKKKSVKKIGHIKNRKDKKICVSCNKDIKDTEHYFLVREFKDKKIVGNKFCHKNCQDNYDETLKLNITTPQDRELLDSFINNSLTRLTGMVN